MSQVLADDFPIDPTTTTGSKLADILNRFADSVNTNNSGGVPSETFAGMTWLDTSSGGEGVLKMRNAANTAWITLTTPNGPFRLADGTVAAPGLAFTSETGLGWYRNAPSVMGLVAQGKIQATFDAGIAAGHSLALFPRAAGESRLILQDQPQGSANLDQLNIFMRTDAAWIVTSAAGSSVQKALNIQANGLSFNAGGGAILGLSGRLVNVRPITQVGTTNYVVPAGVGLIVAMLQAGGGGGGGCNATDATSFAVAGGGGGGGFCMGYLYVTAGQSMIAFLGAPGGGGGPGAEGGLAATSTFAGMSAAGGQGGYQGLARLSSAGAYFVQEDGAHGNGGAASSGNIMNARGQCSTQAFMSNITGGQMAGKGGAPGSGWGAAAQASIGTASGNGPTGYGAGGNGGSLNASIGGGAGGSTGAPPVLVIYEYSS